MSLGRPSGQRPPRPERRHQKANEGIDGGVRAGHEKKVDFLGSGDKR